MVSFTSKFLGLGLLIFAALALQVSAQVQCSEGNQCPQSSPCCSEFGFCGDGRFCLGGCNPLLSFSPNSCTPTPICQDTVYNLKNTSKFIDSSSYNGETTYDFTTDGQPIFSGGLVILTMAAKTPGTRISTTRYVYYGKITARLKTSRTQGVVTAFITMSDIKDEIDWEWVGYKLDQGQSNYFYRGVLDYKNSATHSVSGADTFDSFHDYTIDWQEDQLSWYIDGTLVRTLKKKDTYDSKSGTYMYPSTPSRIQLSVWNGGDGAEGTKEWSGGTVDWNSADIKSPGYYYVQVANISITCGKTPSGNVTSYVYQSDGSIAYSNAKTNIQPKTPASLGLPDSPGSNVNTMPNMTGQYVLEAPKSNSNRLIIATMETTLFVILVSLILLNL